MNNLSVWRVGLALIGAVGLATPAHLFQEPDGSGTSPTPNEEAAAQQLQAEQQREDVNYKVYWKDGLRFESPDGDFKLRIGGRLQIDWGWFTGSSYEAATGIPLEDGTEIRRARINIQGTLHGNTEFRAQYDFAGGDADFKDAWILFHDLGGLMVGQFKEYFGLEQITSSNYLTFMERSQATIAIAPERSTGFGMSHGFDDEDSGTWSLGVFRNTDPFGNATGDDEYSITGRLTWLPVVYGDDGESFVHLGAAAAYRNLPSARFRTRPEAHLVPYTIDTGIFDAEDTTEYGLEAAWVGGPWSLQGEWMGAHTSVSSGSDTTQTGWYVQGSYFLTGEHRPYLRSRAVFTRLVPERNFAAGPGSGAWELGLRYSWLDLENPTIYKDTQKNITVGLNWYMNRSTRVMFNYVNTHLDSVDESAHLFMMRFQVTF